MKTDTPLTFELTGLLGQLLYFTNKAPEAQSIKVMFLFIPQEHNICLLHLLSWGEGGDAADGVRWGGQGLPCWKGGIQGGHEVLWEGRRALKELRVHSPGW